MNNIEPLNNDYENQIDGSTQNTNANIKGGGRVDDEDMYSIHIDKDIDKDIIKHIEEHIDKHDIIADLSDDLIKKPVQASSCFHDRLLIGMNIMMSILLSITFIFDWNKVDEQNLWTFYDYRIWYILLIATNIFAIINYSCVIDVNISRRIMIIICIMEIIFVAITIYILHDTHDANYGSITPLYLFVGVWYCIMDSIILFLKCAYFVSDLLKPYIKKFIKHRNHNITITDV